jgi:hypothetical protein
MAGLTLEAGCGAVGAFLFAKGSKKGKEGEMEGEGDGVIAESGSAQDCLRVAGDVGARGLLRLRGEDTDINPVAPVLFTEMLFPSSMESLVALLLRTEITAMMTNKRVTKAPAPPKRKIELFGVRKLLAPLPTLTPGRASTWGATPLSSGFRGKS